MTKEEFIRLVEFHKETYIEDLKTLDEYDGTDKEKEANPVLSDFLLWLESNYDRKLTEGELE